MGGVKVMNKDNQQRERENSHHNYENDQNCWRDGRKIKNRFTRMPCAHHLKKDSDQLLNPTQTIHPLRIIPLHTTKHYQLTQIRNLKLGANNVFPKSVRGIKSRRRPEFFLKTIMFSLVGTKPQFAKARLFMEASFKLVSLDEKLVSLSKSWVSCFGLANPESETRTNSKELLGFGFGVRNLDLSNRSPSMEVKTSPPTNIKVVIIMSWVLEKASISTVDMLDTVVAETEVKKMSMSLILDEDEEVVLGVEIFKAK
ncbi:conserved hypothetical protein [Ricinus communis]|uniref:Uncharacterized protein n=1 Tax=Ricinus communis TaxID=3988 RepID=B9S7S5_RICCO|nr:conserved hypothetical protein [Ricinus communis]